jgi:hypothetical protein
MPARIASSPAAFSSLPSHGSITITVGFCAIRVDRAARWAAASAPGLDRLELHIGVRGGLRLGVVGDRRDPAVVGGRRGESDGDLLPGRGVGVAARVGLHLRVGAGVVAGAGGQERAGADGRAAEQNAPTGQSGHDSSKGDPFTGRGVVSA